MSQDWVPSSFRNHQGNPDDTQQALEEMLGDTNRVFNEAGIHVSQKPIVRDAPEKQCPCTKCGKLIVGRIITVSSKNFHPNCFECDRCCRVIYLSQGEQFIIRGNEIWCKKCVAWDNELTGKKGKFGEFSDGKLDGFMAGKEIQTGTAKLGQTAIPNETKPNRIDGSKKTPIQAAILAKDKDLCDKINEGKTFCTLCSGAIAGYGITTASGRSFHPECFLCSHCSKPIESDTFVTRNDQYMHPECATQSGPKCSECGKPLNGPYVNIDGNKYHSSCFVCSNCSASISGGYVVRNGRNLCGNCAKKTATQTVSQSKVFSGSGIRVDPMTGTVKRVDNKPKARFCGECGFSIEEGSRFCGSCGTKIME